MGASHSSFSQYRVDIQEKLLSVVQHPSFIAFFSCTSVMSATQPKNEKKTNFLFTILQFIWLHIYMFYTYLEVMFRFFIRKRLKSLHNEIILITGSGRGIGREICLQLANSGAILVLWSRSPGPNEKVAMEIRAKGGKAHTYSLDVSDKDQVRETADRVKREVGDITMLINNAGIFEVNPLVDTTHKTIEDLFKINVFSNFWILKEFLPTMIEKKKGHIVSVCSASGVLSLSNIVAYSSSKHAVHGMMEALRDEIRLHPEKPDIKLTTSYPFFVMTEMLDGSQPKTRFPLLLPLIQPEEAAKQIVNGIRREYLYIFTPWMIKLMAIFTWLLPTKAQFAYSDFLGCNITAH